MKNIKHLGKGDKRCDCCGDYRYSANLFQWISLITNEVLGTICLNCARRELFGNNYRNNKTYPAWYKKIMGK